MITRRHLISTGTASVALALPAASFAGPPRFNLRAMLDHERVPALGLAVVTSTTMKHLEVAGRRSWTGTNLVKPTDSWQIGDLTMGVTSAIQARLIESGKLTQGDKLSALLLDVSLHEAWKDATIETLLAHRTGLDDTVLITNSWLSSRNADPSPPAAQRMVFAASVLASAPDQPVGSFRPARSNYIIAGAVLERVSGRRFEALAKGEAFDWWGASDAGFGVPLGDAPQGHRILASGQLEPIVNGEQGDYPAIMAPATGMHMTLAEYGRFLQLFLSDGGGWLKPASLSHMARPWDKSPAGFGLGWQFSNDDEWAKGPVLSHQGSNAYWRAHVVVAPARDLGILVVCNADSDHACRSVTDAAIKTFAADAPVFNELRL